MIDAWSRSYYIALLENGQGLPDIEISAILSAHYDG